MAPLITLPPAGRQDQQNGDDMHQRRLIAGGALAALLSLAVGTAQAQDFPCLLYTSDAADE